MGVAYLTLAEGEPFTTIELRLALDFLRENTRLA
jgi:hypothetical protein